MKQQNLLLAILGLIGVSIFAPRFNEHAGEDKTGLVKQVEFLNKRVEQLSRLHSISDTNSGVKVMTGETNDWKIPSDEVNYDVMIKVYVGKSEFSERPKLIASLHGVTSHAGFNNASAVYDWDDENDRYCWLVYFRGADCMPPSPNDKLGNDKKFIDARYRKRDDKSRAKLIDLFRNGCELKDYRL